MTDEEYIPRCGDVVQHWPSKEEWVVAWADKNHLAPSGWPPCMVETKHCEVVRKCTDAEHKIEVENWLNSEAKGHEGDDRPRQIRLRYPEVVAEIEKGG